MKKCVVLVANKMAGIPMAEFGGAVLADGDEIIVQKDIADRMVVQYKGRLVQVKELEKEQLRNGHYELGSAGSSESKPAAKPAKTKPAAKDKPAKEDEKADDSEEVKEEDQAEGELKKVSKDKSMAGKGKKAGVRRK